ncbi:MAG: HTH domain-containing protein [Patescibacteria group bacterium]
MTKVKSISKKNLKISKALSNRIEKALLFLTNPRVRDIIERRFGIKNGKIETLESIGRGYGITRERVRQIEDYGMKILKSERILPLFEPVFDYLNEFFTEHGNLAGEEYLYSTITQTKEPHPLRGQLYFMLTIGEPYQRIINDERFHPYWTTDISARSIAEKIVDFLVAYFNKQSRVFPEPEIIEFLSKKHSNLPSGMFWVVLDISKEINKNIFNELGLTHWSEISPQGVKDRAYLILKKQGKPLHFTEITDLINKSGLSDRPAYLQTVHNELIKDPRFVLTGRGTYALSEWGYEPGTVEEVIEKILKTNRRPMTKEEILEAVLAQRQVKPTTILLNLQRSPKTQRLEDGKYTLV